MGFHGHVHAAAPVTAPHLDASVAQSRLDGDGVGVVLLVSSPPATAAEHEGVVHERRGRFRGEVQHGRGASLVGERDVATLVGTLVGTLGDVVFRHRARVVLLEHSLPKPLEPAAATRDRLALHHLVRGRPRVLALLALGRGSLGHERAEPLVALHAFAAHAEQRHHAHLLVVNLPALLGGRLVAPLACHIRLLRLHRGRGRRAGEDETGLQRLPVRALGELLLEKVFTDEHRLGLPPPALLGPVVFLVGLRDVVPHSGGLLLSLARRLGVLAAPLRDLALPVAGRVPLGRFFRTRRGSGFDSETIDGLGQRGSLGRVRAVQTQRGLLLGGHRGRVDADLE